MSKVFVTRKIPDAGLNLLKEKHEVEVFSSEKNPTKAQLIKGAQDADALIPLLSDEIDDEVMEKCSNLKIIANYAVGYDNIDLKAAQKHDIYVSNTPGALTETTADMTWTLLMAAARRVVESDNYVRELKFDSWGPELLLGQKVYGKTIGIIGFGRIGQAVAKRAHGFDMEVLYNKRTPLTEKEERELGAKYADLEDLLTQSDFVTINAALNDSTYHLIDEKELKMMKDNAVLVNTGRGPIINEKLLAQALADQEIFAAGLDVYEKEPEVYPKLLELDNVVLTPHTGSATIDARNKMAEMAAENVIAVLSGKKPKNQVV
jgi:glyoxylate reductase